MKPEGEWWFYHKNGQLVEKGSYKNGKPEGEWLFYHKNGQLDSKGFIQETVKKKERE